MNTPNDPQAPNPATPHDPYTAPARTPDPAAAASPPPPRAPGPPRAPIRQRSDPRGSLGLGIGLAWACLIGGYTVCGFLIGMVYSVMPHEAQDTVAILLALLPWVMMVALIVWMASSGQSRTASGIGLGIATIFGVALLLLAACFGILSTSSFH